MAEDREAVRVAAGSAASNPGVSVSRMKKSAGALPGASRAMDTAPATFLSPVFVGSCAIGG